MQFTFHEAENSLFYENITSLNLSHPFTTRVWEFKEKFPVMLSMNLVEHIYTLTSRDDL